MFTNVTKVTGPYEAHGPFIWGGNAFIIVKMYVVNRII